MIGLGTLINGAAIIAGGLILSGKAMLVVLCLALGTVILFEGSITLLARLISPVMTQTAVAYLSLIGSVLIFGVGLNLVWGKMIRVANMLPAVVFAVLAAYLPWKF